MPPRYADYFRDTMPSFSAFAVTFDAALILLLIRHDIAEICYDAADAAMRRFRCRRR